MRPPPYSNERSSHSVGTLIGLTLGAMALMFTGYVMVVISYYLMWQDCPGYDDEGTVAAPKSWQGRMMCGDSGPVGQNYAVALMAILALWALVVWVRRRDVATTVLLLIVMAVVPIPVALVMQALPDTCSSSQWDRYGDEGCQTDLEL